MFHAMRHTFTPAGTLLAALFVSCSALWLSGCSGSNDSGSASAPNKDPSAVYRTLVRLNPDGTQTVTHATVPRAQSIAQIASRMQQRTAARSGAAAGIGVAQQAVFGYEGPSDCPPNDLWVFNSTVANEQQNVYWEANGRGYHWDQELCVDGAGALDLTTLEQYYTFAGGREFTGTWADDVILSYWPGGCGNGVPAYAGQFVSNQASLGNWEFSFDDPPTNANYTVYTANQILLDSNLSCL
jgi:hypothetical protein